MALVESGAGYVADKLFTFCIDKFKTGVIERWSRRRAEEFISTFCVAVTEGRSEEEIRSALDEIITDETKSTALFDAYRRVALSASPTIGPRIIALVTAKIVAEERRPTVEEERILAVAESLSDEEFKEAVNYFKDHVKKLRRSSGGSFCGETTYDEYASYLGDDLGTWAVKLYQVGFIIDVGGMNNNFWDEQPRFETKTYYDGAYECLCEFIELASPVDDELMSDLQSQRN